MKNYTCPKCFGNDYFLGVRMISGVTATRWNGLKTRQIPICRVCEEIMVTTHENAKVFNKIGKYGLIITPILFVLMSLFFYFGNA